MRAALYFFLAFWLIGCKKPVVKEVVTHTYNLSYTLVFDSSRNKTEARVFASVAANDKERTWSYSLPGNEILSFESSQLQFDGNYYTGSFDGKIEKGNFRFVDENGTIYLNHVILPKPIAQPLLDTVGVDYNYVWVGAPVDSNEIVNLCLNFPPYQTPAHTTDYYFDHKTSTVGDKDIGTLIFRGNRNQLNDFVLTRTLNQKIAQPTNGASNIQGIYTAETQKVYLKY